MTDPNAAKIFTTQAPNPHFEGVLDLDPEEVRARAQELKIVDVRQPEEFTGELGHIQGAELIVLNTIPERLKDLPKDRPVLFVCLSGGRSGQATAYALQNGFRQVYNLRGGMKLWNQLNFPTQK